MDYAIYKLKFPNSVHFGAITLNSTQYTFQADTFFSALCTEAVAAGDDKLECLKSYVDSDRLLFSDAFPFIGDEYYLPKPILHIEKSRTTTESLSAKKAFKNMQYVSAIELDAYLKGDMDEEKAAGIQNLGKNSVRVSANVRNGQETLPYRIGVYSFHEDCGLYIIVKYESPEILTFFDQLLDGLSFSGIGGKRHSGLGRFDIYKGKMPEIIRDRLEGVYEYSMTLSVSLPQDDELDRAVEGASYMLQKRSGFVASENYSDTHMRKKDLYTFQAGSCFRNTFRGDVYDVSPGGSHPVYRYAKPMFMGVSL